ncbi:placenta-expressed transcript 1 protein [Peromyscus maniculatus bairdii]|uniref:Placenta-expressed transcript 1 protein n=1 Tax=Peromyscus maniculatus bairdii TaxID=230844 RepID=A0A6I9KWI2_PERMB|nr:placenta-expressed transcript 1 protein [Peromyscus maniculatus bairdii]
MAVPRAFFLCLALCFSPAFSASYNDPCMALDTVLTSDNPGISTKAGVSGGNRTYTVSVPVNSSVSAVILRAVNQNNHTVGSWAGPDQQCNTSVLYRVTSSDNSNFQATWIAPDSEDVTKINLQVFIVTANRTATMSSVRLEQITTPAPLTPTPETSGTNQTTTMTTAKSQTTAKTTAKSQTTAKTTAKSQTTTMTTAKTTARSLAVNALGSPLAGALHILLVFLISKLLF